MSKLTEHAIRMLEVADEDYGYSIDRITKEAITDTARAVYDTILRVQAMKHKEKSEGMGTNYYAVKNTPTTHEDEWRIHIGKSSIGWLFLFHDCDNFHTYPQVVKWLDDNVRSGKYILMNEYDEVVSVNDFIELVQAKQNNADCKSNPDNFNYYAKNIDGYRFIEGEFC